MNLKNLGVLSLLTIIVLYYDLPFLPSLALIVIAALFGIGQGAKRSKEGKPFDAFEVMTDGTHYKICASEIVPSTVSETCRINLLIRAAGQEPLYCYMVLALTPARGYYLVDLSVGDVIYVERLDHHQYDPRKNGCREIFIYPDNSSRGVPLSTV